MLIPKLKIAGGLRAEDVPQLMLTHGIPYYRVATLNWPEAFPYRPLMEVALAHTGRELLIHYRVSENCIRAVAEGDGGRVWEDSCCEVFLQPKGPAEGDVASPYYNIECNCVGTLLVCAGEDRHNRRPAPAEVMKAVGRWSSLGNRPTPLTDGDASWHMALVVPAATLFESNLADFSGQHMRANVYKCGDCLTTPHFLSLFPIRTEQPDFHRPEFFQEMWFEG